MRVAISIEVAAPQEVVKAAVSITDDPETTKRWRAELAAGRLPQDSENEP